LVNIVTSSKELGQRNEIRKEGRKEGRREGRREGGEGRKESGASS